MTLRNRLLIRVRNGRIRGRVSMRVPRIKEFYEFHLNSWLFVCCDQLISNMIACIWMDLPQLKSHFDAPFDRQRGHRGTMNLLILTLCILVLNVRASESFLNVSTLFSSSKGTQTEAVEGFFTSSGHSNNWCLLPWEYGLRNSLQISTGLFSFVRRDFITTTATSPTRSPCTGLWNG